MCGCLLLPFKLAFVMVKLVFCLVLFAFAVLFFPFLLLATAVWVVKSLFC